MYKMTQNIYSIPILQPIVLLICHSFLFRTILTYIKAYNSATLKSFFVNFKKMSL